MLIDTITGSSLVLMVSKSNNSHFVVDDDGCIDGQINKYLDASNVQSSNI